MATTYLYPWIGSVSGTIDALKKQFRYWKSENSPAVQELFKLEQELSAFVVDLQTKDPHRDHLVAVNVLLDRLGWTTDRIERYDIAIVRLAGELAGMLNITDHFNEVFGHYKSAQDTGKYHCFEHACSVFIRFIAIDAANNNNNSPELVNLAIAALWHDANHYMTSGIDDSINTAAAITAAYPYLSERNIGSDARNTSSVIGAIQLLQFPYTTEDISPLMVSLRAADLTQTNDLLLPHLSILWQVRLYYELRSSWDKAVQFREFISKSLTFTNNHIRRDSFSQMKLVGEMSDAWRMSWLVD